MPCGTFGKDLTCNSHGAWRWYAKAHNIKKVSSTALPASSSSSPVKWINVDKSWLGSAPIDSLPTSSGENTQAKHSQEQQLCSGSYLDLLVPCLAIEQYQIHRKARHSTSELILEPTPMLNTHCEVPEIMLAMDNDHHSASMEYSLGSHHPLECGRCMFGSGLPIFQWIANPPHSYRTFTLLMAHIPTVI